MDEREAACVEIANVILTRAISNPSIPLEPLPPGMPHYGTPRGTRDESGNADPEESDRESDGAPSTRQTLGSMWLSSPEGSEEARSPVALPWNSDDEGPLGGPFEVRDDVPAVQRPEGRAVPVAFNNVHESFITQTLARQNMVLALVRHLIFKTHDLKKTVRKVKKEVEELKVAVGKLSEAVPAACANPGRQRLSYLMRSLTAFKGRARSMRCVKRAVRALRPNNK